MCFTEENPAKLLVVGTGKRRVMCVKVDSGAFVGELMPPDASALCCDVKGKKPFTLLYSGEDREIKVHKGAGKFKHEKSIPHAHEGFITDMMFTPNGNHFVSVSQDKSIKIWDAETYEQLIHKEGAHGMTIIDCSFDKDEDLVTCSSDRTVKSWKINYDDKTIDELNTFTYSDFDNEQYTDNVDKQILGVKYHTDTNSYLGIGHAYSDIMVWTKGGDTKPAHVLRGHKNVTTKVLQFGKDSSLFVSCDQDGRLFTWDARQGTNLSNLKRPTGIFKHKIHIVAADCNEKNVYTGSADQEIMQWGRNAADPTLLEPCLPELLKKDSSVHKMIATDEKVYLLFLNRSLEICNADNIAEVLVQKDKMADLGAGKG